MEIDVDTVGMISNPASGHNRSHFPAIDDQIRQCGNVHHIITNSPEEIDDALARLAALNIDVLAINGGDGTNSAILGRLLETQPFKVHPKVILLPGGTANMNAGDVGVKGSLRKSVSLFCKFCQQAQSNGRATAKTLQTRKLLRVHAGEDNMHHTMFIGGGAIVHGTEYAHQEIHSRGLRDDFSLILGTIRTVWGVLRNDPRFNRHVSINLSLEGAAAKPFDTLILAISTLQRLSFGMQPFWAKEPGDIRLTLMEQHCTRFARTFFSIIRGKPNRNARPDQGYYSYNAELIEMELQGPLNLDGEIIQCNGRVIVTATEALEFIQL